MTDQFSVAQQGEQHEATIEQPSATKATVRPTRLPRDLRRAIPPDLTREEAIRRLEAFYRLTRLVADSNNDVDQLVHSAAKLASDMLGDLAVISLLNMHGETYHIAAYYDPDPNAMARFGKLLAQIVDSDIPRDKGWVATVIGTGKPLLLPTVSLDEATAKTIPAFADFVREVGISGMLIVPITGRSGTLGAIAMTRHAGRRLYTEADQYFLMEMGYRIGLAIESASLIASLRSEVSARLFAREALAASEERFLSIFRSAALGIKIMDLVGTILETNSAFQAICGYNEEQLIAMHFYDMVHPEDVARVIAGFNDLKTRRTAQAVIEHRLVHRDGSNRWVRSTFTGVRKSPDVDSLALIFGMVEDITAHKQAEAGLLELKKHLQHSIEIERLRLAQNLHDVPLQELYAVIYRLEELRPTTRPATSEILGQVVEDIKATLNGLRAMASELRPPSIFRFGLEKAVRSYLEDYSQRHPNLQFDLTLARDGELLAEDTRLVLFRVFQEALANIARHSSATRVRVLFSFDAEEARIEVWDDGKGFTVPTNWMTDVREGHYGLAGMAERVSAAGGTLVLESQPGSGTTVRAVIPC